METPSLPLPPCETIFVVVSQYLDLLFLQQATISQVKLWHGASDGRTLFLECGEFFPGLPLLQLHPGPGNGYLVELLHHQDLQRSGFFFCLSLCCNLHPGPFNDAVQRPQVFFCLLLKGVTVKVDRKPNPSVSQPLCRLPGWDAAATHTYSNVRILIT